MIKLSFTYQGQPFQQGEVAEDLRQQPAQITQLLARIAYSDRISGEMVLHYGTEGPQAYQIKALKGVAPQKLGVLFDKMGFRAA